MGHDLFTWMSGHPCSWPDFHGTAAIVRERFGNPSDLEELLTRLYQIVRENADADLDSRERRSIVACMLPVLCEALRQWFREFQERPAKAYREFAAEILQPGENIITFNYDLSLEHELRNVGKWQLGDGYGFEVDGFPQKSPVKIFKLHGSTNWLASLFGGNLGSFVPNGHPFGSRPVFSDNEIGYLGYQERTDSAFPRGGTAAVSPMILPTQSKEFLFEKWKTFWDSLWLEAATALRNSDKVIICGYSLLPVDESTCQLILREIPHSTEIVVCSGADTARIIKTFQNYGYRRVSAASRVFFQEWVNDEIQQTLVAQASRPAGSA
jgi:hypothetical protein